MGIERTLASAKLSSENIEFLEEWRRRLAPYDVSQSSLINLCVGIVRQLHAKGALRLEPKELQALFGFQPIPTVAALAKANENRKKESKGDGR
jgi:hypothetical protein